MKIFEIRGHFKLICTFSIIAQLFSYFLLNYHTEYRYNNLISQKSFQIDKEIKEIIKMEGSATETNSTEGYSLPYNELLEALEASKSNGSKEDSYTGPKVPSSIASPYGTITRPKGMALPKYRGSTPTLYSACAISGFRNGQISEAAIAEHVDVFFREKKFFEPPYASLTGRRYETLRWDKQILVILYIEPKLARQSIVRIRGANTIMGNKIISNSFIVNFLKEEDLVVLSGKDTNSYVTIRGGGDNWLEATERRFVLECWARYAASTMRVAILLGIQYQLTGPNDGKKLEPVIFYYVYCDLQAADIPRLHAALSVNFQENPPTLELAGFSFECYPTMMAALRHRYASWTTLLGRPVLEVLHLDETKNLDSLMASIALFPNVLYVFKDIQDGAFKLCVLISSPMVDHIKEMAFPFQRSSVYSLQECTQGTLAMRKLREVFTMRDMTPSVWITKTKESQDMTKGLANASSMRASATDWITPNATATAQSTPTPTVASHGLGHALHPSFVPPRRSESVLTASSAAPVTVELSTGMSEKKRALVEDETTVSSLSKSKPVMAEEFSMALAQFKSEVREGLMADIREEMRSELNGFMTMLMTQLSITKTPVSEIQVEEEKSSPKRSRVHISTDTTGVSAPETAPDIQFPLMEDNGGMIVDTEDYQSTESSKASELVPKQTPVSTRLTTIESAILEEEVSAVSGESLACLTPEDHPDLPYGAGLYIPHQVNITLTQPVEERVVIGFDENPLGLEVRPSTGVGRSRSGNYNIPLGKGLFTRIGIERGERIWCFGERISEGEVKDREANGQGGYIIGGRGGIYVDAWAERQKGDFASAINSHLHVFIPTMGCEAIASCTLAWSDARRLPYYIFTRNVKAGEEIFGKYGPSYNMAVRLGQVDYIVPTRSLTLYSKADQTYVIQRLEKIKYVSGAATYSMELGRHLEMDSLFELLAHASHGDRAALSRLIWSKIPFRFALLRKFTIRDLYSDINASGYCGYDSLYYAHCKYHDVSFTQDFTSRRRLIAAFLKDDLILEPYHDHMTQSHEEWYELQAKLAEVAVKLESDAPMLEQELWLPTLSFAILDRQTPKFLWQYDSNSKSFLLQVSSAKSPTGETTLMCVGEFIEGTHTHIIHDNSHFQPVKRPLITKDNIDKVIKHFTTEVLKLFYHV